MVGDHYDTFLLVVLSTYVRGFGGSIDLSLCSC